MDSKAIFQKELARLSEQYLKHRDQYESGKYNESEVRNEFLNKVFSALGWDVDNTRGLAPQDREVLLEKGDCQGKRPDYNFRMTDKTCFYLEAKAPHISIQIPEFVHQTKCYSWSTTESVVPIAVISNFQEIAIYDTTLEPDFEFPERGRLYHFKVNNYTEEECINVLWMLSKQEMQQATLEKNITRDRSRETFRIRPDDRLLDILNGFRLDLGSSILKNNTNISMEVLHDTVGTLINRLIFIRVLEDRGTIDRRELKDIVDDWEEAHGKKGPLLIKMIRDEFAYINENFNGKLFDGDPLESIKIDPNILAKIIKSLYGRKCPFAFNRLDVNTLGHIYEQFLSRQLVKNVRGLSLQEKEEVRKSGGVFYTPREVVSLICEDAIADVVASANQVSDMRILDPACGSGTFLITSYRFLLRESAKRLSVLPEELPFSEKKDLLLKCIFGVDVDQEATKVAILSLCLAALEGEPHISKGKRLLPNLKNNILIRDSIVQKDFDQRKSLDIQSFPIKGKNLCIVGNPPYINVKQGVFEESYKRHIESKYNSASKLWDTYAVFIERALQWKPARLSFIVPKPILTNSNLLEIRKIMAPKLKRIIDVGIVFKDASVETVVLSCAAEVGSTIKTATWSKGQIVEIGNLSRKSLVDGKSINIYADPKIETIFQKIESSSNRLRGSVDRPVLRGVERGKSALTPEETKNCIPCLSGAEVTQRTTPEPKQYLKVDWRKKNIFKDKELYNGPKILVRRVASSIIASVDYSNSVCLNTLYIVKPDSSIDEEVLASYLNSSVIQFWFKYKYVNDDKLFPYVRTVQIADIPLPADIAAFNKASRAKVDALMDFQITHQGEESISFEKVVAEALALNADELKKIQDYLLKLDQIAA